VYNLSLPTYESVCLSRETEQVVSCSFESLADLLDDGPSNEFSSRVSYLNRKQSMPSLQGAH